MSTKPLIRSLPQRLATAAAACAFAFALMLAGCNGASNGSANGTPADSQPAQPNTNNASTGTATPSNIDQFGDPAAGPPSISFQNISHDFGNISETDSVTTTFTFTNKGQGTLRILEVKPTCSCTAVTLSQNALQPGQSGTIDVRFSPTATGKQVKMIHVASNDTDNPKVTLTVRAEVEAFIVLEPPHINLGSVIPGEMKSEYVSVLSPDPDMRIVNVTATDPNVTARIVQASSAEATAPVVGMPGQALIEVTVAESAEWGPVFSWINVMVEGTPPGKSERTQHTRQFRVTATVHGDLMADPDTFRAGAQPNETFTRNVTLKRLSGQPFRIIEATIEEVKTPATLARATLQLNRISDSAYDLELNCRAGQTIGNFTAVVNIKTDVPGEENIKIQIAGRVIGPAG